MWYLPPPEDIGGRTPQHQNVQEGRGSKAPPYRQPMMPRYLEEWSYGSIIMNFRRWITSSTLKGCCNLATDTGTLWPGNSKKWIGIGAGSPACWVVGGIHQDLWEFLRGSSPVSDDIWIGFVVFNYLHPTGIGDPISLGGSTDFWLDYSVTEKTTVLPLHWRGSGRSGNGENWILHHPPSHYCGKVH